MKTTLLTSDMAIKKLYFKHDIGARNDLKLQELVMRHGAEGLGIYWCLVEVMYENGGYLPAEQYKSIAFVLHVEEAKVLGVLQSDLFTYSKEDEVYSSERVLKELGSMKEISEKRKASIRARWEKYNSNTNVNKVLYYKDKDKDKDKDKKEESSKEESQAPKGVSSPRIFKKPTVQEVEEYCRERKNGVDAERFWNFYESKGWKVGNAPMKSWKAAITTWEKRGDFGARRISQREDVNRTTFVVDPSREVML